MVRCACYANRVLLAMLSEAQYSSIITLLEDLEAFVQKVAVLVDTVGPDVVTLLNDLITLLQGGTEISIATVRTNAVKHGLKVNNSVLADIVALAQLVLTIVANYGPEVWALVLKIIADFQDPETRKL